MNNPLPCVICRKKLESAIPKNIRDENNQPHAGTVFQSQGHYGSTAFDPIDGSAIELNLCDECLTKAAADGIVLYHKRTMKFGQAAQFETKVWDPNTE